MCDEYCSIIQMGMVEKHFVVGRTLSTLGWSEALWIKNEEKINLKQIIENEILENFKIWELQKLRSFTVSKN